MYRIAQQRAVADRQDQFRREADHARLASRIHRKPHQGDERPRKPSGLRVAFEP